MKNKKKLYGIAFILASIFLIRSCSEEKEQGAIKEIKTTVRPNSNIEKIELNFNNGTNSIEDKAKISPRKINNSKKEKVSISNKNSARKAIIVKIKDKKTKIEEIKIKNKTKEKIELKPEIKRVKMFSKVGKVKKNTFLLFGNFNFFDRNNRNKEKKSITLPTIPEEKPLRPIDDFKPITPEVSPIIIWKNEQSIRGDTYTLTEVLKIIGDNYGLRTTGGKITNEAIIKINTDALGSTAVKAINKSEVINNGLIDITRIHDIDNVFKYETNIGIYADNSKVTNGIDGRIFIDYVDSYGIKAVNDSYVINQGRIESNSISIQIPVRIRGMYADNSIIINDETGILNLGIDTQNGIMMEAVNKSTAINKGIVSINGYSVAMSADNSTIINERTGIINTNYIDVGMSANNNSKAINKGVINVGRDSQGLKITNSSIGTNEGVINLNGDNSTGIYVDSTSTYTNTGTINIADGTTGNREIVTETGARFLNSGSIIAKGEFNADKVGGGQIIMSEGGSLEAETIKGDIYASGTLALGGYEDQYSTYKMLKTTNLKGEIISNSAMFNAHFTENKDENGFYDVVLDRKDFKTIVKNEELGEILEDNYEETGNRFKENYYDALKLVTTEKRLNKAAEDSYGMSYYPTLAKQTFEIAKDSNQVIVDQVLNNTKIRKTGETIAIAGVNATKLKNDSYSNVSGYDTDLYSVYLGAEKQINKDTRIGGIVTIGKGNTDSKDVEGSRDDYYYQGNIYYTYENKERLKFTSMIYGGIIDTSLERTLVFGSLNETMKDDVNNYYLGLNNELSKKYYFNRNYLKPKFELNFTYMMQDDISESGDQGLKIDDESSTSIETGLGLALGRDFYMDNGSKINLEGSVTGYAELGNPYKDLDSTFETLSTDKVKIEGYNNDDFYGDIMIGGSYETKSSLKLFTKLGYRIGNDSDGVIGNIGLNYLF